MNTEVSATAASCLAMRGSTPLTQDRSISMIDQGISPLRRRMIEDMPIRKFAPKTQHDYYEFHALAAERAVAVAEEIEPAWRADFGFFPTRGRLARPPTSAKIPCPTIPAPRAKSARERSPAWNSERKIGSGCAEAVFDVAATGVTRADPGNSRDRRRCRSRSWRVWRSQSSRALPYRRRQRPSPCASPANWRRPHSASSVPNRLRRRCAPVRSDHRRSTGWRRRRSETSARPRRSDCPRRSRSAFRRHRRP